MKNPFLMEHATIQEVGLSNQLYQQFVTDNPGDVFLGRTNFALNKGKNPVSSVLSRIKSYLKDGRIAMPYDDKTVVVTGTHNGNNVLVWIVISIFAEVNKFRVDLISEPTTTEALITQINTDFASECLPLIKWWFQGRHGEEVKEFYLTSARDKILPEFYPDLDDPDKFLADFINSDESVMLLAGPPGTGKTTLLRYLITKYKMTAHVIYDERLMERDTPFQTFLFGDNDYSPATDEFDTVGGDIMIIEDADTILQSRETDGNKLMSRFLNISDGLIKLPNKKLVFTTNITDFSRIDSAILRPGRCFSVMHTRTLNLTEAQAAARAAKLPIPMEKREYTLAELFNQGKSQLVRTIGFGVRH